MKLRERFRLWLDSSPREQLSDVQCEIIAEEFAEEFMDWVCLNYYYGGASTLNKWKNEKGELITIHQLMLLYQAL